MTITCVHVVDVLCVVTCFPEPDLGLSVDERAEVVAEYRGARYLDSLTTDSERG